MKLERDFRPRDDVAGRVAIVGLGYVGLTLAVVAADCGYQVLGIEVRDEVVQQIANGRAHFFEQGLEELMAPQVQSNRLVARTAFSPADDCQIYIITVGTPIGSDKRTQTASITAVARTLKERLRPHDLIILRSTVRVGVTREIVKPILDQAGVPYRLAFCPERTIEGKALRELRELPQIVAGIDADSADAAAAFFGRIAGQVVRLESLEAAELVKLVNNTERDLRFAFANEIAAMCDVLGLAAQDVIGACNFGYARSSLALPGPVGGPCLTKDPYILAEGLETHGLQPRLALIGRETNAAVVPNAVASVHTAMKALGALNGISRIAVLGLAFKGRPATSDLRGSTIFDLVRALKQSFPRAEIVGYDPLVPAEEIRQELGIAAAGSIEAAFSGASVAFLHNNHPALANLPLGDVTRGMRPPAIVYDFWGQNRGPQTLPRGVYLTGLGAWPKNLPALPRVMEQAHVA